MLIAVNLGLTLVRYNKCLVSTVKPDGLVLSKNSVGLPHISSCFSINEVQLEI